MVDPADLLFASPTTLDHIGRIVAAVEIDGKGPFRFIIDTGANHSTVSPRLVALLGLTASSASPIVVEGITGSAQLPSVPIAELRAGDLVIRHASVPIVWSPIMAGADGILGVAELTKEQILVDFRHDRVVISRSRRTRAPNYFTPIRAHRVRGGLMSVDAHVGAVSALAIIDTGSERTIGNMALRNALFGHREEKSSVRSTNVYGATRAIERGELDSSPLIDLGPVKIGSATLVFGNFHIFEVWGLEQQPALIIGMDVLGSVPALAIDFQRETLYVDSNSNNPMQSLLACQFAMRLLTSHCGR